MSPIPKKKDGGRFAFTFFARNTGGVNTDSQLPEKIHVVLHGSDEEVLGRGLGELVRSMTVRF